MTYISRMETRVERWAGGLIKLNEGKKSMKHIIPVIEYVFD